MAVKLIPALSASDPDQTYLGIKVSHLEEAMDAALFREIVSIVAQRYVEAHFDEIIASISPQAISNLAIAQSAKKIAEEIQRRPTYVHVDKKGRGTIRDL